MADFLDELAAGQDVISGGDEDFSAFAVSRWPGLVRLAFGLTGDRRAAEDLAQAALARAYVAWRRVRRADDPDAYLRRILVNAGNRRLRGHRGAERPGVLPETAVEGPAGLLGERAALLAALRRLPPPVDAIIRRGRGIRLRRAATVAGVLGVVAIIAAAILLPSPPAPAPPRGLLPVTVPARGVAGPGGVFASGTADGRPWRLAVRNIADPGYRCIPAITVNGTDADPVYPAPGNGASVAPGFAAPGIGFAFVQVPADIDRLVIDGIQSIPAIAATACGLTYRVVGFAYRLAQPPRITAVSARPGWPRTRRSTGNVASDWPAVYQLQPPSVSQPVGVWNNEGRTSAETAHGLLGSGRTWSITLTFGTGGACYQFSADVPRNPETGTCGPIGTPDGPGIVAAMPLSYPPAGLEAPTGYVVQLGPATARLRATASDGSTQLITPRLVDGRKYAAFIVGPSLRLIRLTWLNAIGRPIASSTALPRSGYTQFRP